MRLVTPCTCSAKTWGPGVPSDMLVHEPFEVYVTNYPIQEGQGIVPWPLSRLSGMRIVVSGAQLTSSIFLWPVKSPTLS